MMADKQNKNLPEQPETETSVEKAEKPEKTESPKKTRKPNAAFQKKLKYGGLATAITCVAVAIVVVVNLLVSRLVERYPLKLDLTANGVYEISEDSISFLQGMEKEVNFTVLMSESSFETNGTYMKMVSELLERYAQYSDKIHLTYADPTTNPDVVNRYQTNYAGTLTQGDIVVSDAEDDTKIRVVSVSSLFSYDQQKYNYYAYTGQGSLDDCITGFSGEQNLTSALMYVTDANPVRVAVLASANGEPLYNQNYNGYSLAMFSTLLMRNGYDIQTVDLYTDTLDPAEYDLAVLPAPVNDLTSSAIDNISAFLYNDGEYNRNLIYFADFTQSATPNLDELLSTWGIEVTQNLVMEGNSSAAQQVSLTVFGSASVPVAQIADETYAEGLANTSLPIVAPFCRSVNLLWDSTSNGITTSVLKTADTVYLNEMNSETENTDKSAAGEQTVMAVSSRKQMIDNVSHGSSVMVFGSMMLADYNVLQVTSYNNAQFLVSAVNHMTGKESGIVIAEKPVADQTVSMTAGAVRGSSIAVFAVPMAIIVIGVVVIVRRRNK